MNETPLPRVKPTFFDEVAAQARGHWNLLEANPEVAGPWHALFKQVDSPRHVLSELLQNAEDAEATWARCAVVNGNFVFEHNGVDFNADALGSLCRFAYSNKRALHTIGFRGIGFKTTFSIGPDVSVMTPTLAFRFQRNRFTEPQWLDDAEPSAHTSIRVPIIDKDRVEAVQNNLHDWLKSPAPLLFFSHLTSLTVADYKIEKQILSVGPVARSQWMILNTREGNQKVLRIVSSAEPFPADAVAEIRQERGADDFDPGECTLDLILGLNGENRLYTVLPTAVSPRLPFSCNAPFIQDPSRYRIKDPASSPTNRWLLQRLGTLAAQAMVEWLGREDLPSEERVKAYELLPDAQSNTTNQLDSAVREVVCAAFAKVVSEHSILLEAQNELVEREKLADLPAILLEAWDTPTALRILGDARPYALHPDIDEKYRTRLAGWKLLDRRDDKYLLAQLERPAALPRPTTDEKLIQLWAQVEAMHSGDTALRWANRNYALVPVQRSTELRRPKDVVRVATQEEHFDESDRAFLRGLVSIADGGFLQRFDQAKTTPEKNSNLHYATQLYRQLSFESSSVQRAFDLACRTVFARKDNIDERLRLVRIAVKAELTISDTLFRYLCLDGQWRSVRHNLIWNYGAYDGDLLPEEWLQAHAVSPRYVALFQEEEQGNFRRWLDSDASGLRTFPIPQRHEQHLHGNKATVDKSAERGGSSPDFKGSGNTYYFTLRDLDWDKELLAYWTELAKDDDEVWARVVEAIIRGWGMKVSELASARIDRPKGAALYFVAEGLRAGWLHRLQSLPCVRENRTGKPEIPHLLLRRNPNTEPLLQIEKFVHSQLDTTQAHALLDLLGVRDTPQSANRILQRLASLSVSSKPPVGALLDLYRALNGVWHRLDIPAVEAARQQFRDGRLLFGSDDQWHTSGDLFQSNDELIPGAAIIHPNLGELELWDRLRVPRKPTLDAVLEWLRSLPSGMEINEVNRRRVVAVLEQAPRRAADECRHWLTTAGTWTPFADLRYYHTDSGGYGRGILGSLFKSTRRATADFSMLTLGQIENMGSLTRLDDALTYETVCQNSTELSLPLWLRELTVFLLRAEVALSDAYTEIHQMEDRFQAISLYESRFCRTDGIAKTPYLAGDPAGTEAISRALWQDGTLFVAGSESAYFRELVSCLQAPFKSRELREAIRDCAGRTTDWIADYFAEHFTLRSLDAALDDLGLSKPVATSSGKFVLTNPSNFDLPTAENPSAVGGTSGISSEELEVADTTEFTDESTGTGSVNGTDTNDNGKEREVRQRQQQRTALEVLFIARGFSWDAPAQLWRRAANGDVIRRETSSRFWTLYGATGIEKSRFFDAGPLGRGELLIRGEDWLFLQRKPISSFLIALGHDGTPWVVEMAALLRLRDGEQVDVAAAEYRLSFVSDSPEALGMKAVEMNF